MIVIPLRDNATSYDTPYVTLGLIFTCIVVFALQWLHPQGFAASIAQWGEVPTRILNGENVPGTGISSSWTMLTAMFMHAGGAHIAGNMIALWLFGDNIEWLLGRFRFLVFYLACGLAASGFTVLAGWQSDQPGLGASGAIAGVMVAYLIFYPRAKITSLVWFGFSGYGLAAGSYLPHLRNISAVWFIGSWILLQAFFATALLGMSVFSNLGIYAHFAGAIAGAIIVWPLVIQARKPKPTDPEVCAELTTFLIGDEGDAGGNEPIFPTLGEEVARLKAEHPEAIPEFHDFTVEDLLGKDDVDGALKHAELMLLAATESGDSWRIHGYQALINRLRPPPEEPEGLQLPGQVRPTTIRGGCLRGDM
jgi:membrane associated rhomboid family serine protease